MWVAWLFALGAGLSTTIGSLLGLIVSKPGPRFMSFTLGFSAGIMIFISFVELLAKAIETEKVGFLGSNLAFLLGWVSIFLSIFFCLMNTLASMIIARTLRILSIRGRPAWSGRVSLWP